MTRYPGWAGVSCKSEVMAAWLLRATLVEGILTRREGEVLYLPVGVTEPADETGRVVEAVAGALRLWRGYAGATCRLPRTAHRS